MSERRAALAAVVALGAACNGGPLAPAETPDAGQRRALPVEAMILQPTTFRERVEVTGVVRALEDAVLSAQAGGTVLELAARGARVRRGQVLVRIDPNLPEAAVQQAQADLAAARAGVALARDRYGRLEPLAQEGVISPLELEGVRAELHQAEAQLARARAALEQATEQLVRATVRAPFAGVVEDRFVERGEQVAAGAQLVRLVEPRRVRVEAGVPERYAGDVTVGDRVAVILASQGEEPRTGTVAFAGVAVDPASRTFTVEVEVSNPEGRLKPQMTARLDLTRRVVEDALVVPEPAVVRDEEGPGVFVVVPGEDGPTARRRAVQLGPRGRDGVVLLEGVRSGDEVVVTGQQTLADGTPVTVRRRLQAPLLGGR